MASRFALPPGQALPRIAAQPIEPQASVRGRRPLAPGRHTVRKPQFSLHKEEAMTTPEQMRETHGLRQRSGGAPAVLNMQVHIGIGTK